jgi:uncharacterized protein YciI
MTSAYFFFIYKPGPAWLADKPMAEQPSINEHFEYMAKLEHEGKLIIGGPFKDSSGAMGIIEVTNLEEAEKLMSDDPAVAHGTVEAEIRPWHPAVPGCIEQKPW